MPTVRASKLRGPLRKSTHVDRPRLDGLLDGATEQKMTVIVAPAGFGKTTLLAAWAAATATPVAWLSLDEADNDPTTFLHHLVTALAPMASVATARVLASLKAQPRPSFDRVVGTLVDGVDDVADHAVVAFDDFHVITSPEVQNGVATLVAATPSRLHVVIATRTEPPLALARLRVRGELNEIRAQDLRFTTVEAAALLRAHGATELSTEQVGVLEARTEGWAAGLQLVALALRGRSDARGLIEGFSGRHPFVFDYLVEEVVGRQSDEVQAFLTSTSILDRLSGPLCDAVMDGRGGAEQLRRLERANLFVVALDDDRRWFRYHRLFADVLQDRLRERCSPADVGLLHLRASRWYERSGLMAEAADHAVSAGDVDRAATLVEGLSKSLVSWGELTTLRGWLARLPNEVVHRRPLLLLTKAWCDFLPRTYQVGDVHALLDEAERLLSDGGVGDATYAPRELVGMLAAIRTAVASAEEDAARTLAFARQAREHLGRETYVWASVLSLSEGLAHDATGDARAAERALGEAIAWGHSGPNAYVVHVAVMNLARVRYARGALRAAAELCERELAAAGDPDGERSPIDGYAHVVLGGVDYDVNDLEGALLHLQEAVRRGLADGHVRAQVDGCIGLAHAHHALGNAAGADEALGRAHAYGEVAAAAWAEPLVAWHRGLLALRSGDLNEAAHHVAAAGAVPARAANAAGRSTHAVEGRLLAAVGRLDEAVAVVEDALDAAEAQGRTRNALELAIVRALVFERQGRAQEALDGVARVIARAEQEGFVRIFLDEGEPMRHLLRKALDAGVAPTSAARLLASFGASSPARPWVPPGDDGRLLNPRELSVLRLMAGRLSDKEIARELTLSVSTIKWYSQRIFGALEVHRRTEAVTRAKELGLL